MDASLLVSAMATLSRTATEDFSAAELLASLCRVAAEALDVDGAGVMIRSAEGRNLFVHASCERVQPVERLQETLQQGPCADSMTRQEPVVIDDLTEGTRWPTLQRLSSDLGLGAVLAMPMLVGQRVGVLDLYRLQPGPWRTEEVSAQVLADMAVSYLVMAHDRDESRRRSLALAHRAMHDALTGLPNRALLFDRLEHALSTLTRRRSGVAVIFLDLDLFKTINDTFGHAAADTVLVEVAERLAATLRAEDTLARFAGDEFVIVCEGLPQESPERLAKRVDALTVRLQSSLQVPIQVGRHNVVVTASMGVAVTTDPMTGQELIADADTAMYAAKQSGRGRVQVRNHTILDAIGYAGQLERDLVGALERGELTVFFQPIVRPRTGQVAAVEALLRWHRPHTGLLPAAAFMDIAENSGLMTEIGHWVITETCRQMKAWQRELADHAPAVAFVNLSAKELADPTLPGFVSMAIQEHGLHPGQLGLEIVEENLATPEALDRLHAFHRLGHPLSIDDFGTGYSSLSRPRLTRPDRQD